MDFLQCIDLILNCQVITFSLIITIAGVFDQSEASI